MSVTEKTVIDPSDFASLNRASMSITGKVRTVISQEDCFMATNRSQRLRKKLCVDEFQELGFELNLDFN